MNFIHWFVNLCMRVDRACKCSDSTVLERRLRHSFTGSGGHQADPKIRSYSPRYCTYFPCFPCFVFQRSYLRVELFFVFLAELDIKTRLDSFTRLTLSLNAVRMQDQYRYWLQLQHAARLLQSIDPAFSLSDVLDTPLSASSSSSFSKQLSQSESESTMMQSQDSESIFSEPPSGFEPQSSLSSSLSSSSSSSSSSRDTSFAEIRHSLSFASLLSAACPRIQKLDLFGLPKIQRSDSNSSQQLISNVWFKKWMLQKVHRLCICTSFFAFFIGFLNEASLLFVFIRLIHF